MTGHQIAGPQVIRVSELLPYPGDRVWHALTSADLVARWLMVNGFKLETGRRIPIESDPIRRVGLGGTGQLKVLAFEDREMLRLSWKAGWEQGRRLDSVVTFTLTAEGAGTRLLIQHDGHHPCGFTIGKSVRTRRGCRTSVRHVGEVSETLAAWRACVDRIRDLLSAAQPGR